MRPQRGRKKPDRRDRRRRPRPHSAAAEVRVFVDTLRTLYVTEAVQRLTGWTSHRIELKLKRVHPRGGDSGSGGSNLYRKHHRGEHAAERPALQAMVELAPQIEYDTYSVFWSLLELIPRGPRETRQGLLKVDDVAYYSCHEPFLFPSLGRFPGPPIAPMVDVLTARGTPDAVATLVLLALGQRVDPDIAWSAARALPAALTIWGLRPGVQRVLPFVWARLRQLGLDALRRGSLRLLLEQVEMPLPDPPPGYPLEKIPHMYKRSTSRPKPAPIKDPVFLAWLERHQAPETDLPPAATQVQARAPAQWARDFELHANAARRFHAVLLDSWGEAFEPARPTAPPGRRLRAQDASVPAVVSL
jgi:hypothetical protein